MLGDGTDADVIALAEDPLEVAVQIFYVRGGRIRGQRGWVADQVEEVGTAELVEDFLLQLYGGGRRRDAIPREVLVPALPPDAATFEQLLGDLRGSRVRIRVPQRGDKRTLLETVARNADQSLALHKTKRASDLTTRSRALEEIQEALGLTRRRCGSSATTSPTCRAPRSSPRWWCSRTGWPARASTAGS